MPPLEALLRDQPLLGVAAMFGAGLATSLTPCIYPMIPITAGILGGVGATGGSRARTLGLTLVYVGGLALVYASLGLLAGLTGQLFGTVGSNPWAYFAMGNLLLVSALALLDVIPLRAPQALLRRVGAVQGGTVGAVFLLGATSGLVAAPCGAPAFAAALTFVGATQSAWLGFVYLLAFSVGMTALLVGVGLSSGFLARLPRSGPWMARVKVAGGIVLIGVAEYYFVKMGEVL